MKEQILAVQRMQDYIEAHLDEKIGLSELSEVSMFFAMVFLSLISGIHRPDAIRVHPPPAAGQSCSANQKRAHSYD